MVCEFLSPPEAVIFMIHYTEAKNRFLHIIPHAITLTHLETNDSMFVYTCDVQNLRSQL